MQRDGPLHPSLIKTGSVNSSRSPGDLCLRVVWFGTTRDPGTGQGAFTLTGIGPGVAPCPFIIFLLDK